MAGTLTVAQSGSPASVEDLEAELFVEGLYRRFGIDFRGFERERLRGKLELFRDRHALESISSGQGRALRDAAFAREAARFLSASPSAFAGSTDAFTALRLAVLPVLRSASWPVIWLAECGDAAALDQIALMLEQEGLLAKTQLFVTHANEDLLAETASLLPAERRRENVIWAQYDLASDASFKECDLIVCQRPLCDFDLPLQRRTLSVFSQSLANFGILQLDAPGSIVGAEFGADFTCLLGEQGIYRRLPA